MLVRNDKQRFRCRMAARELYPVHVLRTKLLTYRLWRGEVHQYANRSHAALDHQRMRNVGCQRSESTYVALALIL